MFINRNISKFVCKYHYFNTIKRNFSVKNVTVVDTVDKAKEVVEKVLLISECILFIQLQSMTNDIHACDTETTNFDMTRGPLGIIIIL